MEELFCASCAGGQSEERAGLIEIQELEEKIRAYRKVIYMK